MNIPSSAPHAHGGGSIGRVMYTVSLALAPATAFGVWQFGWPALNLLVVTIAACYAVEAATLRIAGKPLGFFLTDGSALLTGLLLALTLPPWAPWWIGVVGAILAILIGKAVFGGLGQNLFNPAMVARVALLISFPLEMTTWTAPLPLSDAGAPGFLDGLAVTFLGQLPPDTITGASVLGHVKTSLGIGATADGALHDFGFALQSAALGTVNGSLGETSALLILAGGIVLIARGIISWRIPASFLGAVFAVATLAHLIDPGHYTGPLFHLFSGGVMLGALFIATDPVTSPSTPLGQLIFGAVCGALVWVIRTWGGYPEGVAFAVLIMNAATPLIDHYTRPRIYGRTRRGEPLTVKPNS
ncbi:RnfABCDGE type electron transport complex subunit D [Endothiovibrio diazotrophicus]